MATINLDLPNRKRDLFKKATKERNTNMRAILSAFIDLYLMNPDRFLLKMEAGNHMFPKPQELENPGELSYMEKDFKSFKLKQAITDGKKKDEYYLKLKDNLDERKVLEYMKTAFTGCKLGLLDPERNLSLPDDIYVIAEDEMVKDVMMDSFEALNNKLGE